MLKETIIHYKTIITIPKFQQRAFDLGMYTFLSDGIRADNTDTCPMLHDCAIPLSTFLKLYHKVEELLCYTEQKH